MKEKLAEKARERWVLDENAAKTFAETRPEDGCCNLSLKALQRLLPEMEKGVSYGAVRPKFYPEKSMVQQMSVAAASTPSWQAGRSSFRSMESPWPDFVDSIRPHITNMVVSHRPEHKMSGALHKKTILWAALHLRGAECGESSASIEGNHPSSDSGDTRCGRAPSRRY